MTLTAPTGGLFPTGSRKVPEPFSMAGRWFLLVLLLTPIELSVGRVTSLRLTSERQERSDDAGPLESVVADLSQQVGLLRQQLNAANAKIASLETTAAKLERTVAFYAGNSNSKIPTPPYGTIILNTAFTNVGNGYDTTTGVFTAPVSGLYDFQATFMQYEFHGTDIYAHIAVDGRSVAAGVADHRGGAFEEASIRAIVHVTSGQKVAFKSLMSSTVNFYGRPYTRFSGFLIKAD